MASWGKRHTVYYPPDWEDFARRQRRRSRVARWAGLIAVALTAFGLGVWYGGGLSAVHFPTPLPQLGGQPAEPPPGALVLRAAPAPPEPAAPATTPRPAGVPPDAQAGVVERVVDGDTIWVRVDRPGGPLPAGATHKVRLLEIDSPETGDSDAGVQCWGPESSAFAARLLPVGSPVYLAADREDTDRYGRYLRYAWTADGQFFNLEAVRRGHARAVLYQPNDAYIAEIRTAEREASSAARGLWGPPCQASASAPQAAPAPAPARTAPPAAAPQSASCHPSYVGTCVPLASDVDCPGGKGDGPAYVGPVRVVGDDEYGLDRDLDGVGCEQA